MGFPRLEPTAQAERLPILLSCLEGRSQSQQDRYITYSKMLKRFFDIVPWQISYIIAFLVFLYQMKSHLFILQTMEILSFVNVEINSVKQVYKQYL